MEISGGGAVSQSNSTPSSNSTSNTEIKPAESAAPSVQSNAPDSPTAESAPRSEGVESLNLDPVETVSDPSASENLVNEQSSVAEELGGAEESTFPEDDDGESTDVEAAESVELSESAAEADEALAEADPALETEAEAAAESAAAQTVTTPEAVVSVVSEEEALAAIDAQLEASGLPALDPAHRPETVDVVVTPLDSGGQMTVQNFEDPTGAFTGSFQTITDENGEVIERIYEGTLISEFSVPGATYDEQGQLLSDSATMREIMTRSVHDVRQEDGSFASTGDMTFTIEKPPDTMGFFERSTVTGEYNSSEGEMVIERVGPDGTVYDENRFPVGTTVEEPPSLNDEGPFSQTQQLVHLPDGGTRIESQITDEISQYSGGQSVILDPEGHPVTRTSVVETPHLRDGVSGIGFMQTLGITSGVNLMEDNIGPDPVYLSQTVTVEQFGSDGEVGEISEIQQHSWTSQDGNAELAMIDLGDGIPREYRLTKNEEGRISTQSFLEGTEDTVVSVEEVDAQGFRVVRVTTDASDAAEAVTGQGESAQEAFTGETRMKEDANLSDLQSIMGPRFDTLLQDDPAFAHLVNGLEGETFVLLDLNTSSTILNPEGEREIVNSRGVSINLNGQTHILVTDGENTGLQMSEGLNTAREFNGVGATMQSAGILAGTAGDLANAGRAANAFQDLVVEGLGDLRQLTRIRRAAGALNHSGPMGAVGVVGDTIAAIQAAASGDTTAALLSTGRAAENLGQMTPAYRALATSTASLEARTVGFAARSLGVAGSLLVAGTGAYDLIVNQDVGGAFGLAAGLGGAGHLLAAGSGGAIGALGFASGAIGGAAVIGGLVYDYSDSRRLAPQRI